MSKIKLKKYLEQFSRDEVIEVILNLYDARKEAKDYLEFFLSPDEKKRIEKVKETIYKEFFKTRGYPRARVTVCKKAIKNFASLGASHEAQAEIIFYYFDILVLYLQANNFLKNSHIVALKSYLHEAQSIVRAFHLQDIYKNRINKNMKYLEEKFPYIHSLLIDELIDIS